MLKGGLLMSLRKRLITGIGLILLILGIGKPLTEAAVQALKPKAVQTSVVETNGSCKPNCNRNGKLLNIPFLSWLPKKQMKNDEDLCVWDTNEKPKKQKDLKPKKKKNKLIVVGVENAKRGTNEKGGSSSSMLLMSLLVLPLVIIGYIVWRKRRKTKKQDEESIRADIPLQPYPTTLF